MQVLLGSSTTGSPGAQGSPGLPKIPRGSSGFPRTPQGLARLPEAPQGSPGAQGSPGLLPYVRTRPALMVSIRRPWALGLGTTSFEHACPAAASVSVSARNSTVAAASVSVSARKSTGACHILAPVARGSSSPARELSSREPVDYVRIVAFSHVGATEGLLLAPRRHIRVDE